jgi:FtsP/CotA-like multicopper oxidase with cupredoxin domain
VAWCALALLLRPTAGHAASQAPRPLMQEHDAEEMRLREAQDLNPDRHIIEINLTARIADVEVAPGKRVKAWTYDGGLPGPLIRGRVGDRLIVHFKNELPDPTTVHWHGVRVPIEMDGVPGISQPDVRLRQTRHARTGRQRRRRRYGVWTRRRLLTGHGKVMPRLRAHSGALQRWRIVNAATSRFFYLEMGGQPFTTVGTDGGIQEKLSRLRNC